LAILGGKTMNNKMEVWTKESWEILSEFSGTKKIVDDAKLQWEEYQKSKNLRLVVFGAYNAGKSSLMKRLLVENGTDIPDWLIISGKRETFEVNMVCSNGFEFIDTPGLSSGTDEHDVISLDILNLSDAYIWVLPPQLITSEPKKYFDILGAYAGKNELVMSILNSTIVTITSIDEAGIDPSENLDGFKDLVKNKIEEFKKLLKSNSVNDIPIAIHGISPDPHQLVKNKPQATPKDYDGYSDWDGINTLQNTLDSVLKDREILRSRAGARFVAYFANEVKTQITEEIKDLELIIEGLISEIEHHEIYKENIDVKRKHLLASLHRDIEEELLSVSRASSKFTPETLKNLEESLIKVVDEWAKLGNSEFEKLINEFEVSIDERIKKPSFKGLIDLIDRIEVNGEGDGKHSGFGEIGKKVLKFGPAIRSSFNSYAESEIGTNLKNAAEVIEKSRSTSETLGEFIKNTPLKSMDNFEKASKYVKWGNAMSAVGPILEQMGGIAFEVIDNINDKKMVDERAKKRKEIRRDLRTEAKKIEIEASQNLETLYDGLHDWIDKKLDPLNKSKKETEAFSKDLKSFSQRIEAIV